MPRRWMLAALFVSAAIATCARAANAQINPDIELNTTLMQSTFKIHGDGAQAGSVVTGTVFLMGRPFPKDPHKGRYVLITAAHVLNEISADSATIDLRQQTGPETWVLLPISVPIRADGHALWTTPPGADVAVMYIRIPTSVSIPIVSTDLLADDTTLSDYEIHPGDELECLGYPLGLAANSAGFPILRSGKIASYPLLPTSVTKTFLFDFRVFSGNSGGPVYFVERNRYYKGAYHLGQTIHFIIGLVSEQESFNQRIVTPYSQESTRYPLSLAVIVHASLIKQAIDTLPSPDTLPN